MRAPSAVKACVAVLFAASCAGAQNGPAAPPAALGAAEQQSEHRELDGKCKAVRPGDVVHFTLRIEGVQEARVVSANLQMRLGRVYVKDSGLPPPDFRSLGGGSAATRDARQGNVYHFDFVVPRDVLSGLYHGSDVYVTAAQDSNLGYGGARSVDVTNHTMKEIRNYCLIVVGPYGGAGRPLVTDFKGGPVERIAANNTPQEPASSRIFLPTR